MNNYFGYIRVSTAEQVEGASLQEQRAAIEAFAVRQGAVLTGWFEEVGTAAKLGRGQFNKMLSALERREADGVIIHKIDRSARHLSDWARIGELLDLGVAVHFAHENLDLTTRGGRLAADIQAVVATDYIRNLRQETRKGINGRLKQGLYPCRAPLGYLDRGKGQRKEIDPVKGPLVRKAFEIYATGQFTVDELRAEMLRRGLRNHRGSPLSRNGMWTVLRNPFYIGLIHIKRTGSTYEGVHDPLVRKSLFDRCQAILSGRKYPARTRHNFPFSRFIRCSDCGRSLIGECQKGHIYYRCHSLSCRGVSLNQRRVAAEIAALLECLALDDGELRDVAEAFEEARGNDHTERAAMISHAKLLLGRCDDLLSRLTDAYLEGTVEKELFETRKSGLLAERRQHLEVISAPALQGATLTLLKKIELGNTALNMARIEIEPNFGEAVSMVMSNLVITGKDVGFILRFPFDRIMNERIISNGDPYRAEPRTTGVVYHRTGTETEPQNSARSFREFLTGLGKAEGESTTD